MKNINKTKTILFASLIAAMILPLNGISVAEAQTSGLNLTPDQVPEIADNIKYQKIKSIVSSQGTTNTKGVTESGLKYDQTITVDKIGENQYDVTDTVVATSGKITNTNAVSYTVNVNSDGSYDITIPDLDNQKLKIREVKGNTQTDGTSVENGPYGKLIRVYNDVDIDNDWVSTNETYYKNCGFFGSTTLTMDGAADANDADPANHWRYIHGNANSGLIWRDYCIFAYGFAGTDLKMGGSSYQDEDYFGLPITNPVWGPTDGLQFPVDNLDFEAEFKYIII